MKKEMGIVTLTEFGDYQCPHCRMVYPIVKKLQKEFGEKLHFEFRNFPLVDYHPMALMAAEAAESARAQGKFDEMHDALFDIQPNLGEYTIVTLAKKIGLDMTTFASDLTNHTFIPAIKKDLTEAMTKNVRGTPTFFIDGRPFEQEWTYANLVRAIRGDAPMEREIIY
ncbi:MAG: thioredoxin domain-containing protein [Rhizobacter sp.]|nr:thioredoxin domain-containing protein [Bacteriovorax sp.]